VATMTGGCLCGAVRYVWEGAMRLNAYACHCTDCQTRSGSAFSLQQPVFENELQITGELIERHRPHSGGATARVFACARCLTRIHATNDHRPGLVVLFAGTLDDSASLVPGFHIWTRSMQPWIVLPGNVPSVESSPATLQDWQSLLVPTGAKA
jgi:hypothetical protein